MGGALQFLRLHFQGVIDTRPQLGDALGVDVETQRRQLATELHRQRQTHITQSNYSQTEIV